MNAKRGLALLAAIAALELALSGCGGGGSPSGAAATARSSQSSIPAQSPTTAQNPTSTQSASAKSGTTGSTSSGSTNSNLPTASTHSVTINWLPPTENTDDTALTNLAGYTIHYGTASGNYTQAIPVSNAGLTTYVVDNLTPGKYYFAVAAMNSTGTESPLSSEVSATVN